MKVLLVEDNLGDARLIREMLRRGGAQFELAHVRRLSQALQRLDDGAFDVILLDLGLPDSQGIDTFDRIHAQAPDAPIVVLSGTANEVLAIEIVQHGAQDYLIKGQVDSNPLVRAIRYAIERKRMEEHLANANQLKDFLNNANDLIQSVAPDGRLLYVNRAWRETLGYTEEEAANLSIFDVVHSDSLEHCMGVFQRVMSGEKVNYVEAEFVAKDGRTIAVEGNINCRLEDGKPVATRGIFRDVTERKRAKEALRESEEKLGIMFSSIADGIIVTDLSGNIIDANEAALRMHGYSNKDELIGRKALDLIGEESRDDAIETTMKALGEKRGATLEYALLRKDGGKAEGEGIATLLSDSAGNPIGIVVVTREITERKRTEAALRESEEKLRFMFESTSDGIVVTDLEGIIISVNDALARIAGFNRKEELIGRNGFDLLVEEDGSKATGDVAKAKEFGRGGTKEYALPRNAGGVLNVEVSADLLKDGSGNPVGIISVVRDITERKQAEGAIRQRNRELRAMNDIAKVLSRPMSMDKMLNAALDSALDVTDMSSGGIWLVDETGGVLTPATYKGVSSKFKKLSDRIKVGEGITGQAAETGELVFAPDFLRDVKPNRVKARMEGLQSIIGVPLKARGKTMGVMTLFERGYRPLSPSDIQMLETIGGEIGIAIENTQLLEKLGELSVTDELTGLYNRRRLYEVLDAEATRTQRYGHPFSLVIIDLDGFKKYNDTFGHVSGDVALDDFANALRLTLRKTDVAFRHGGDEFAVILPSTDACKARKVIQRLRTRWEQVSEVRYKSLKTPIGFSAGIAQFPGDAETADGLLAIADITMYHAKEEGKHRTEMASR